VPSRSASTSATRRDLPTPAGPNTVASWHERDLAAFPANRRSTVRSSTRPTMGRSSRLVRPGATGLTVSSRQAATGAPLPFSVSGSSGVTSTASRTSVQVPPASRISPGLAACWSRAATLTVSPRASAWATAGSPASTSPVLTPVRSSSVTP
jgi:hypothetical protein